MVTVRNTRVTRVDFQLEVDTCAQIKQNTVNGYLIDGLSTALKQLGVLSSVDEREDCQDEIAIQQTLQAREVEMV